jgi:hypothetical protein
VGFGLNIPICGKRRGLPGGYWVILNERVLKKAVVMPPLDCVIFIADF